ncbi:MAG: aminoglycoside phosphotransferase family protein [Myxococcota bacterium]|nr:aminoglycoside phosphotransferase family protein [Myxococcota bacterium]
MQEEADAAIREALACYPVLEAPRASRIPTGLIHETWHVLDGERGYVLQRLNPIFSLGVHDNIEAVTSRLVERGVLTPRLCRTRDGSLFVDLGDPGRRFRLMTEVQGRAFDTCPSPAHAASAGRLVGRFHTALDGLDHDFAPLGFVFHDTGRHFEDLDRAIETHRDHRMRSEVVALARRLHEVRAGWTPLDGVPNRVVHLDLKFNNLLLDDAGEACCLIDLDTLSRAPLWVELGDAWRSWCNRRQEYEPEAELDVEVFEASAAAWREAVALEMDAAEIASLAHGIERLSIELAARFAADVLDESYFGWNRDRFASAGEHNLSRARGQLSLHDQARETRADRLRFLAG